MEHRFAFVLAGLLGAAPLGAASYYVAPNGNDSAAGSLSAPWATLAKAAAAAQAGDTVYLRQGAYRQTLTAVRSGTAGSPIVFRGYPGESAVLAGSDLVTGAWSQRGGNIWQIDGLPATWSVYVDGVEMVEARWPNLTPGAAMTSGWASAGSGSSSTHLADPNLPALALNGAKVRIIPGAAWVAYSRTVQNYAAGSGFDFDTSVGPNASYWPTSGNQYFLYRSLALLDTAGEWYQDPTTLRLYLWVPGGGDPGAHVVEIAKRKAVASVNAFSYIELRDLFTFSGWISIAGSTGSKVLNVHQRYVHRQNDVDGYNFELTHNELNGGSACEWSGGSIDGSSGDGLYVAGTGHTVQDMVIHNVDQIGTYRGAVRMAGTDHIITQNTFYDSGRFLIFHDQAKRGALTYNHLYNAGLLTRDMGATYCYRCNGGGMQIAYNHIHDVHCQVGAGIYLDNAGSNFRIHHNLVHDVDWFALKLNLPSYDNLVVNNTLFATKYWVNAAGSQYPQEMTGTALVNNLHGGGGTAVLITGSMGPTLISNGSYTAPPAIFNTGAWTLAPGSPAIDKGTVYNPYATVYCGAAPDQGCFESGCGTAWSAGSTQTPPPFPYPFSSVPPSPTPTATRTRTPAPSPTPTATGSATRSATASATLTALLSATPSSSPSATRSSTASATGTASRTASPAATASVSPSVSATPSRTPSAVPSATPSPTPSASRSASPSPTPSATPSPASSVTGTSSPTGSPTLANSVTATQTASATPSASPISSPSGTPSMSASVTAAATLSATPSASSTPLSSATLTPSPSASAFSSATPSESPALSASATATASPSLSVSPSGSPSASPTLSATPSPSASATVTVTASPSLSVSASASSSPTGTGTVTESPTLAVVVTATPTASRTAAASPSSTATPTGSPTMSFSSPSPSAIPTSTPAPTPLRADGSLHLREALALPNPVQGQHLRLRYFSDGPALALQLQVYSASNTCVLAQDLPGPGQAGWDQAELQLPGLAPGYYSARLRLRDGGRVSEPRLLKLWLLP
jgi:hypothetical protein